MSTHAYGVYYRCDNLLRQQSSYEYRGSPPEYVGGDQDGPTPDISPSESWWLVPTWDNFEDHS